MALNLVTAATDVSTAFKLANEIIGQGIRCVELDTGKIKVGNGIDRYNDLPYTGTFSTSLSIERDFTSKECDPIELILSKGDTYEFFYNVSHKSGLTATLPNTLLGYGYAVICQVGEAKNIPDSWAYRMHYIRNSASPYHNHYVNNAWTFGLLASSQPASSGHGRISRLTSNSDGAIMYDVSAATISTSADAQIIDLSGQYKLHSTLPDSAVSLFIKFHPDVRGIFKMRKI